MATAAQIAANRANARKSTGPRTAEGRAKSALNALKHGLTAQKATLPGEDPAAHERLRADLFARFQPVGEAERRLVDKLALLEARLERAGLADVAAWNACWDEDRWPKRPALGRAPGGVDHLLHGMGAALQAGVLKQLQLITLYERRLRRELEQARADLAALQAQRAAAEQLVGDGPEAARAAEADAALALLAHFECEEAIVLPPAHDFEEEARREDPADDSWLREASPAGRENPPAPTI